MNSSHACADPGIFVRRVRSSRPDGQKSVRTTFYLFICLSPHRRILQFTMICYGEIYTLPKIKRESNIIRRLGVKLSRGSNFFQKGIHLLISRNPYNLWFSRGGTWPPIPFWIRTCHDYRDTKLCNISSHVFLVLKRIVPLRRFFLIPAAHVVVEI